VVGKGRGSATSTSSSVASQLMGSSAFIRPGVRRLLDNKHEEIAVFQSAVRTPCSNAQHVWESSRARRRDTSTS
jgi:hypothetical protein